MMTNQEKIALYERAKAAGRMDEITRSHICQICKQPFKIARSKDLCHPCYLASQPPSQLKLWHIIVYKKIKFSELVHDTFLVTASTEQKATDLAFKQLGYIPRIDLVKDESYHIREVEGPFTEGTIVWRDSTAEKK